MTSAAVTGSAAEAGVHCELRNALRECFATGFAALEWKTVDPLSQLAARAGLKPIEHRQLEPRERSDARPSTLSRRYGLCAFPWHTDAAHWLQPARLLVMRSLRPTLTPTLWLDVGSLLAARGCLRRALSTGSWVVSTGPRRSFYCSMLDGRGRIRFNPEVMAPVSSRSRAAQTELAAVIEGHAAETHRWDLGEAIIIDNARLLHARPAVAEQDTQRKLERMLCDVPDGLGF
jgi:alpha-ketoglutarate-dependent taurine dioxygenase